MDLSMLKDPQETVDSSRAPIEKTGKADRPLHDFPEHISPQREAPGPLAGMRVIDFTHFVAGPFSAMILADLGAEVIKVEPPRGEDFRQFPPADPALDGQGSPFLWANRNKKSIALNLKSKAGLEIAKKLVASADVLVENYSTGVMERFGLGYEGLRETHPKLIYTSVSAYGRMGPYADRLGFDTVIQAESGFMSFNGYPDREGVRVLPVIMDTSTALMAANGILAALLRRARDGIGQRVDVSLYDTGMTMVGYGAMQYLMNGVEPKRLGNSSSDTAPTGAFRASDASFFLSSSSTTVFQRVFRVIGRDDIADDPELQDRIERLARHDELRDTLNAAFGQKPWEYWEPKLREAGVPAGEIRSLADALHSKETRAAGLVTKIPHPTAGFVPNIALPIRLSDTPMVDPVAAPTVGQHTTEILGNMGYDPDQIAGLEAAGAFGPNGITQ